MNQVQLISLDLDGTLLDPAGQITQASRDAIARARAAGVRVVHQLRPLGGRGLPVRRGGGL